MLQVKLQQQRPIPLSVAFDCQAGETLALVGPSGSGKTTILRCIAGLSKAESGSVTVGADCWQDSQHGIFLNAQQRRIGLVFQSFALFPHLTANQNVQTALGHLPHSQRTEKAAQLLQSVHLDGLDQRYPGQLSGGQQQRVALARALAREPAVLLLDEPFSAVDQVTRRKLRLELATLTRSLNIPIILVTHDLDEAAMLAQRICVIHAGNSLQIGQPAQIFQRPNNATVARLLDSVNIFTAEVRAPVDATGLITLSWLGQSLQAQVNPSITAPLQVGQTIPWMIPPSSILLHRQPDGKKSAELRGGERENPIFGEIVEMLTLSGMTTVVMRLAQQQRLTLQLSPHVVSRNALALGQHISVSLPAHAIHVMPN